MILIAGVLIAQGQAMAQEPNHACDAACQRAGRRQDYGIKPAPSPKSVDPIDQAIGDMFIELLLKQQQKNASPDQRTQPQERPIRPQLPSDSGRVISTFQGLAIDQGGRKRWPFNVEVIGKTENTFVGRIYWPTLQSIHMIEGRVVQKQLYFREITAVQRGGAVLGCEYRLTSDLIIDLDDTFESVGAYQCSGSAGRVRVTTTPN